MAFVSDVCNAGFLYGKGLQGGANYVRACLDARFSTTFGFSIGFRLLSLALVLPIIPV